MDDDLPTEYDVIILGTGVAESIAAAAFARIGQRVLHLDRNDHYGGDWSTFNFEGMQRWIESHRDGPDQSESSGPDDSSLVQEGETLKPLIQHSQTISNVQENWFIKFEEEKVEINSEPLVPSNTPVSQCSFQLDIQNKDETEAAAAASPTVEEVSIPDLDAPQPNTTEEVTAEDDKAKEVMPCNVQIEEKIKEHLKKEWTVNELKRQWRKFNIELAPKLLFCRGPLVELLISSDIAKYCEFKTVSRILTQLNGKLEQVPCSRADVFSSKSVSMIEKRMLMKFLTFCMDYDQHPDEYAGFEDKPFKEFLVSRKLTGNIQHYVLQSIAMATDETTTINGLAAVKKFLVSLGRYGNTAFLWTLYGSGELPQAFCRMCAVFGGIYCLRRTASNVVIDSENKCIGAISDGVRLKCKWLVAEASYVSPSLLTQINYDEKISRAFFLTRRSIKDNTKDEVTFLRIPHPTLPEPVTVIEVSSATYSVPEGLYLVYVFCRSVHEAREDLQFVEEILFPTSTQPNDSCSNSQDEDTESAILWSVYFNQADHSHIDVESGLPENIVVCTGPDTQLDFDTAVQQARCIFSRICPDEEFLPRAPNPEDIIYDEGSNATPQDPGFGPQEGENNPSADDNTEPSTSESAGNGPRPNTTPETVDSESGGENGPRPDNTQETVDNESGGNGPRQNTTPETVDSESAGNGPHPNTNPETAPEPVVETSGSTPSNESQSLESVPESNTSEIDETTTNHSTNNTTQSEVTTDKQ